MKIQSIKIRNFRSISSLIVNDIRDALVLVGRNNAGKSSLLNGVRAFWGQYDIKEEDFHKNEQEITIEVSFVISPKFYENLTFDAKVGFGKIPSIAGEFNSIKEGTIYSEFTFNDFKADCTLIIDQNFTAQQFKNGENDKWNFWKNALDRKFKINDNALTVKVTVTKSNLKIEYTNSDNEKLKDVDKLFPRIAFIDDDRNFEEEEVGKSKTLTADLFGNYILKEGRTGEEVVCHNCIRNNCTSCIEEIYTKDIRQLDLNDLEKLTKRKVEEASTGISQKITEYFCNNYTQDYGIRITPKSNIDKSFSINTQIVDPRLNNRTINLSNVGAGVRSIYILSLLQAYHEISENNNIIFLIEEPEIYLHPSLQKIMGSILLEISKKSQVVFSTHSPLLLRSFEIQDIKSVFLSENYSTNICNANLEEVLNDLGYSTEDILNTEFILFVEGKDDHLRLKEIISKYYSIDITKISIIAVNGCSNLAIYASLKFLDKTNFRDRFLILRDSDTKEPRYIIQQTMNQMRENLGDTYIQEINLGAKLHILNFSSLDNYFLNPDIMMSIRIVSSSEAFYQRVQRLITQNRSTIMNDISVRNRNNQQRIGEVEELLYGERSTEEKIEDIKKYVRGHNLFGQFQQLKNQIHEYVNNSSPEDFNEILNFLDTASYFSEKRI